ncbi:aldose epimerase family protein [Tetragenococcus koreensis]|uniref:aldose epimerase family protein n=1 Tax=Tetragenococcus koreensis TaxID=290335 RepID=UPI001F42656D|nr:aldose epimerase family protein [Tetragenococcus koreensis]MCF1617785.1 galactose mutarotase [Tetragenococcus koreensis]MCF1622568.1 galactose mutarotase [Tetragenococcus koreensis]MCF1632690.1 galactose mutarotase [Tetragenococcus koreensis]MCF1642949.1 galactose mutarotase [Tetragenococcus koreensis]MCF1681088.1 galactose mutarotase [Tetragenococcus koreensis]
MNSKQFGVTKEGHEALLFTFENKKKMKMTVSNFGAVLTNLWIPDKSGIMRDIVLGYDTVEGYESNGDTHFGATIGRNANRIENARFELHDKEYKLAKNDGENNLHSGPMGYELRLWNVKAINEENNSITFSIVSPDGDQSYPGELCLNVTYQLQESAVVITYNATSNEDTIFNPTNHSYFNLNGHQSGDILKHKLQINASTYTPVKDEHSIPTGEILPVEGTPLDFRNKKRIDSDIQKDFSQLKFAQGYDHNFVIDKEADLAAHLEGDQSGISMDISTNLPGVQFYTSNFLENIQGKDGAVYPSYSGVCLETQFFPNAINEPMFDSPILKKNEERTFNTIYQFSTVH